MKLCGDPLHSECSAPARVATKAGTILMVLMAPGLFVYRPQILIAVVEAKFATAGSMRSLSRITSASGSLR